MKVVQKKLLYRAHGMFPYGIHNILVKINSKNWLASSPACMGQALSSNSGKSDRLSENKDSIYSNPLTVHHQCYTNTFKCVYYYVVVRQLRKVGESGN